MKNKNIYNINCADFLMKHGAECIGTGIDKETNRTYWIFNKKQCQNAYNQWNKHKTIRDLMKEIKDNYDSEQSKR